KYLPLEKEHLKTSTAMADPNAHGQRNTTLAWFWSLDVQSNISGNDWMTECEPRHFCDCWNEEVILIKHEMQWTINFVKHKAKQWLVHMDNAALNEITRHACYATRQSQIYHDLAGHVADLF
ncbi:hypothetical protein BDR06DRAFT_852636, partial [Suillus hirtellus]